MDNSVQVTTSARLSDEGAVEPGPCGGGAGTRGSRPDVAEARGHGVQHYVHIYRARHGPGQREDVEKGAVATWKVLYRGDGEEKGTRTMTPNHADKMQPVQHRTEGPQQEARAPGTAALRSCRGGPGCHSQPPLLGGLGRHPATVTMGREAQGRSNIIMRINLTRVFVFGNNFLESLCSQEGSLGVALPCRWAAVVLPPPLPSHAHTDRAGGQDPEAPGSGKGRDLLRVTGRAWPPSLRHCSSMPVSPA